MTLEEYAQWAEEHAGTMMSFMDFEASPFDDEDLTDTLNAWFADKNWSAAGHRFVSLGIDGTGGLFNLWIRAGAPEGPHPVVLLGSEGGHGVLAADLKTFILQTAHAVFFSPYEEPACAEPHDGDFEDDDWDDDDDERPRAQHARYQAAVEAALGPIPPLAELTAGLEALNTAFCGWVGAVLSD